MKFADFRLQPLGVGAALLLWVFSAQAADLSPNISQPGAKTPPTVEGGLEVPPAVGLDQVPDVAPAEPTTPAPQEPAPTPARAEVPSIEDEPMGEAPVPTGKAKPAVSAEMRPADKKTVEEAEKKREEEGIYFNVANEDIREIIKQISRVTGKNFILDDKIRGEITILSEQKLTKEEVYEAFLSALDVAGYTTVDGPAGLIKIVKHRDALSRPIPIYTDKTPYTDQFITRLITLKNINAVDMANVIKGLVSKEGNLFAYPATNTLILTDSGTNIGRIIRLVEELDTEGPQEVLEIIPIEYADAQDIADKITQLFGEQQAQQRAPARRSAAARRRARQEAETPDSVTAVPSIGKVITDERTNSIILLASKITIARVRDIIRRLDKPLVGPEEGDIHVLYLKNAKASELAEVLTGVTEAAKQGQQEQQQQQRRGARQAAAAVPSVEFEGLFGSISSIRADDQTNSLIIQANAKDFRTLVERIIAKLDIPRRQVYIETFIMELQVRDSLDFGTGGLGGGVLDIMGTDLALFGNTFPFLPDITTTSSIGGATTENDISFTIPFGGGGTADIPRFFAAFVAQRDDIELNVLSTPNILTLDNTESRIKVGDTIPFLTGSAVTTGGLATNNVQREDVALELAVTPQITEGDNVRLSVKQTIEDFNETVSNPLESTAGPATSVREIESEIVVPNQNTVVIGGLMQDSDASRKTKIPLLGDIPILGHLFKTTSLAKRKTNLLMFLTPTIVREPQDFLAMLRKKITERNRFIDEQFGEKSRKRIREAIGKHHEQLVDFKPATSALSEPGVYPTGEISTSPYVEESPTLTSQPPVTPTADVEPSAPVSASEPPLLPAEPSATMEPRASAAPSPEMPTDVAPPEAPPSDQPYGPAAGDIDLAF